MGSCGSKDKQDRVNHNDDFCPLRVASIYADIGESINKQKKIRAIVDYFMNDYYSYKLDVMCLQGIQSYKVLKEIIRAFKTRIDHYNDEHGQNGNDIYLEYFPDIDVKEEADELNWSTSETEETDFYDKLIITRHAIMSKDTPALGVGDSGLNGHMHGNGLGLDFNASFRDLSSYEQPRTLNRGLTRYTSTYGSFFDASYASRSENIMNGGDSDRMYDGKRHIQVANLNVDGTYVSIYNVELKDDVKGIRSGKERKAQIFDLKKLINQNRNLAEDEKVREFEFGDDRFVAHNRDIHIVTGMFHINEMRNDAFNPEYMRCIQVLEGLDTHRWIMAFRSRFKPESTNIKYSKDAYTFLIWKAMLDAEDLQSKAIDLYTAHKTLVTSSIIMRSSVDMNYFTDYPIDTLFMIYKPKIDRVGSFRNRPNRFIREEAIEVNRRKAKRRDKSDSDSRYDRRTYTDRRSRNDRNYKNDRNRGDCGDHKNRASNRQSRRRDPEYIRAKRRSQPESSGDSGSCESWHESWNHSHSAHSTHSAHSAENGDDSGSVTSSRADRDNSSNGSEASEHKPRNIKRSRSRKLSKGRKDPRKNVRFQDDKNDKNTERVSEDKLRRKDAIRTESRGSNDDMLMIDRVDTQDRGAEHRVYPETDYDSADLMSSSSLSESSDASRNAKSKDNKNAKQKNANKNGRSTKGRKKGDIKIVEVKSSSKSKKRDDLDTDSEDDLANTELLRMIRED